MIKLKKLIENKLNENSNSNIKQLSQLFKLLKPNEKEITYAFNLHRKQSTLLKKYGIKTLKNGNITDLLETFPWFKKCKCEDAVINMERYPLIDWEQGTWINGTWDSDNWFWENGVWKNGVWKAGRFNGGTWLDGEAKQGSTFTDCTIKGGIFQRTYIFRSNVINTTCIECTVNDINFKNSVWDGRKYGDFGKKAKFINSQWKSGNRGKAEALKQ